MNMKTVIIAIIIGCATLCGFFAYCLVAAASDYDKELELEEQDAYMREYIRNHPNAKKGNNVS